MNKVSTPVLLTIISIVDLIWGSQGGITFLLWVLYGIYKLLMAE